ncbi:MAG: ribose 5-phosphate isomerase A [Legionellales bacterium]|nr:ribose 5-phosphate isomerase A [Legionellales bacterium]HAV93739.1 ribose 5-phosphate isomerase A [Pseudomonadota bacterium]|tara:strand:+ start:1490 stop:2170 length:681 start_codon:yes stop_codon:yes gene_type:complete
MQMNDRQDQAKSMLAQQAMRLLSGHKVVGLGAGTTVIKVVQALSKEAHGNLRVVVASLATLQQCKEAGIDAELMQSVAHIDLYIDGADEVDPSFCCIKGRGGAMVGEKLCAQMADEFIVLVDDTKLAGYLGGKWPVVPLEVVPWARSSIGRAIVAMGGKPELRETKSDMGNDIIDCHGLDLSAPYTLSDQLNQMTGVVGHGLFVHEKPTQVWSCDGDKVWSLKKEG